MQHCYYWKETEIHETSPGACDGKFSFFQCPRPAFVFCDDCGATVCGVHGKVCFDCGRVYCHAEGDIECCFAEHTHDHLPMAIELELARTRQIGTA
jgi:hypothetical protein